MFLIYYRGALNNSMPAMSLIGESDPGQVFGDNTVLSDTDIAELNYFYQCPGAPQPPPGYPKQDTGRVYRQTMTSHLK